MQEKHKTTIWILVGLAILVALGFMVYRSYKNPVQKTPLFVSSFEDCAAAGYPLSDAYPRQCFGPEGKVYLEESDSKDEPASTAIASGGCYIGGCSQQICSDEPDAVSDCEYRPEYSCYKKGARCERQSSGECGWTETSELMQCLNVSLSPVSK